MATCLHCGHRKGKRSCPALAGTICATCCGQHRLRDIDCPAGCVHLGGLSVAREAAPTDFTKSEFGSAWQKLYAYADRATAFRNEALLRVLYDLEDLHEDLEDLEDLDPISSERDLAIGYLFLGHRDAGGRRLIDHFIATRGRDLSRGEMAAAIALRDAWASLFEVAAMHAELGLELRDLRSGEFHRMRELQATEQLQPGDVMFAWVMTRDDRLELAGIPCIIPRPHREPVRAAIEAELAVARTRWPGAPERELVGSTAGAIAEVFRTAVREPDAEASQAPQPDDGMATDDAQHLATTEPPSARSE